MTNVIAAAALFSPRGRFHRFQGRGIMGRTAKQGPSMSFYDPGMRIPIELPEADVRALDALARRERVTRTQLLRRAIGDYLERQGHLPAEAFGAWDANDARGDGLTHERRMRLEW